MKDFEKVIFNPASARQELQAFRELLSNNSELSESEHLLPFFRERKQLIALFGFLHQTEARIDNIAWEYDLFGDFTCDFVAAAFQNYKFFFVELQDAKSNSIFCQGKRYTSEWAPSLEEGFSQVVDWAFKIDDSDRSDEFEQRFGTRHLEVSFLIVVGRSSFLKGKDLKRFQWRRNHIAVDNKQVRCLTYDELLEGMNTFLNILPAAGEAK